jgi:hypothetical protein
MLTAPTMKRDVNEGKGVYLIYPVQKTGSHSIQFDVMRGFFVYVSVVC